MQKMIVSYLKPNKMAIMHNGWIWRKYNSLIFIVLLTELYTYLCKYYYPHFLYINFLNGVNGQLNLWVDRQLVIQIIESMPHNQNIPSKLRCPRRLPEIHRHIPEHLFLVFNGLLLHEALDRISLSAHRPIPPRIDMLRVKWRAGFERLTYNIDLKSMNHTLLHTPLLNIAKSGYIPATQSAQHTRFIIKCECRAQCLQSNTYNHRHPIRKRCIRRCRKRFGLNNPNPKQTK
uniref:WIF domain-containing protein n=1 Tax=Schistosoma haematobium TaxID=6185 RepID=A0A095AQ61_SCHHA